MTKREEIRDGQVFTVTVLPADRRLRPSEVRKRALKPIMPKKEQAGRAIGTKKGAPVGKAKKTRRAGQKRRRTRPA